MSERKNNNEIENKNFDRALKGKLDAIKRKDFANLQAYIDALTGENGIFFKKNDGKISMVAKKDDSDPFSLHPIKKMQVTATLDGKTTSLILKYYYGGFNFNQPVLVDVIQGLHSV
ncbi:MAG: hypothetical protein ABH832_02175 [bacterium]